MEKHCLNCNKIFKTYQKIRKFCSTSCASSYNRKIIWKDKNYREKMTKKLQENAIKLKNILRGKTYEERYGFERAQKIKEKIRESHKGMLLSEETRKKLMGRICWRKGLTKETDDRIKKSAEKLSKFRKGKTLEELCGEEKAKEVRAKMRINAMKFNKKMKRKDTSIEIALQSALKNKKINFDTEVIILDICTADIVPKNSKIAIFCDGDYWHNFPKGTERDRIQTNSLINNGWKVLRFWEYEIEKSPEKCASIVMEELNNARLGMGQTQI